MKGIRFEAEKDGFYGAYFANKKKADHAFIVMLGDDADGILARNAVKWLHKKGYNCLAMSPAKKDYSHHNYPLQEEEKIKIENIKGHVMMVGAKDDTLWNAYMYVKRMDERLKTHPLECEKTRIDIEEKVQAALKNW